MDYYLPTYIYTGLVFKEIKSATLKANLTKKNKKEKKYPGAQGWTCATELENELKLQLQLNSIFNSVKCCNAANATFLFQFKHTIIDRRRDI